MKTPRNPSTVHSPLAQYSHQIEVSGKQRWLILSGQVGQDISGPVPADPIEQLELALANVGSNLAAADMSVTDIVKMTFYYVGDVDIARRRQVLTTWLDGHSPCMTLLFVSALAAPDYRVEIDVWACADEDEEESSVSSRS